MQPDPKLIRYPLKYYNAIMYYETGGHKDPSNAVSVKGAKGNFQVTDIALDELHKHGRVSHISKDMLFDPKKNIEAGISYLNYLEDMYPKHPDKKQLALAMYNGGPKNVRQLLNANPNLRWRDIKGKVGKDVAKYVDSVQLLENYIDNEAQFPQELRDLYQERTQPAQNNRPTNSVPPQDNTQLFQLGGIFPGDTVPSDYGTRYDTADVTQPLPRREIPPLELAPRQRPPAPGFDYGSLKYDNALSPMEPQQSMYSDQGMVPQEKQRPDWKGMGASAGNILSTYGNNEGSMGAGILGGAMTGFSTAGPWGAVAGAAMGAITSAKAKSNKMAQMENEIEAKRNSHKTGINRGYDVYGNGLYQLGGRPVYPQRKELGGHIGIPNTYHKYINTTGYTPGTPTMNNPMNIIMGDSITTKYTPITLMATASTGERRILKPGVKNYKFKGAKWVMEMPYK